MKKLITVWCPNLGNNATVEPHEIPLQLTFQFAGGKEDVEVYGNVPRSCPLCSHEMSELERDGIHAEIGEEADKVVEKMFPSLYVRVMIMDAPVGKMAG